MQSLEERLNHSFSRPELLRQALTHPSAAADFKNHRLFNNQRLEFLGDAVLQLALSETLYRLYPDKAEGLLTKLRTRLVQTNALARVARGIDLGPRLHLSRGEESNGGRNRDNILADAMEAVIGAVFLDGGYKAALAFIENLWKRELAVIAAAPVELNPKGQLQEILQDYGGVTPTYRIIASEGPDHEKSFLAVVTWNGHDLGQGSGRSKKEAETAAARAALESEKLSLLKTARQNQLPVHHGQSL